MWKQRILSACLVLWCVLSTQGQVVFQPVTSSVYDYLDEVANEGWITLNSAVKPYSRIFIAERLRDLEASRGKMNRRQQKELDFYLRDFNKELKPDKNFDKRKDLFYYKDSLFSFTVNPILGGRLSVNSNGSAFHRWNGGELFGSIGEHFSFAANLRDNGLTDDLYGSNYLVKESGGNYKVNQGQAGGRIDYSEMRGAISYGWKWGSVSVMKDQFEWGNNYHGANIFSGRQPSFAYLNLKVNPVSWFDFNYVHGWLVSEEIDSAAVFFVNGVRRRTFMRKYLAANLFTISPWKKLQLSFGNSVVYSDKDIQPGYLIPFFFFKSVDHTYNGAGSNDLGENSQMFFDFSSRQINKLHLYVSGFVDEISISNLLDADEHTNVVSLKTGARVSNLLPNHTWTVEYTRTNPWTYRHQIASSTFASNEFNLGHYMGSNAEEIYLGWRYKPVRGLHLDLSYTRAIKGEEMETQVLNGIPQVQGLDFIEKVAWFRNSIALRTTFEVINDGWIFMEVVNSEVEGFETRYTPEFYRGNTTTVSAGINFGF